MSSPETVVLKTEGPVARIVIRNPPLNVLTVAVRKSLLDKVAQVEARTDLRAVIIESAIERAFSVGSDIREFPDNEMDGLAKIRFEQMLLDRIAALPLVTVAKLRGLVLGGGSELMLACDFQMASEDAQIGFPEIRLGALPAAGGMKRLVRVLGPLRARELVLLGRPVTAARAAEVGLITAAVPAVELDQKVEALVTDLVDLPAESLRVGKRAIAAISAGGEADTIEAEAFGALYRTPDLAEGLKAFVDKRPPRFNGRGGDAVRPAVSAQLGKEESARDFVGTLTTNVEVRWRAE